MSDILIPFSEIHQNLAAILKTYGFSSDRADVCAKLFAKADLDGVRSHGVNKFLKFLEFIRKGNVKPNNEPILESSLGVFERWDGLLGVGNLNAEFAMSRAIKISEQFGIGCVALKNTNHWMRAGNFGWQAVDSGKIGICFTNTKPNMPAWGGSEPTLGNNPLVIAIPRKNGPVVLDMAMSQFAYGKLENYVRSNKKAPFPAGFDEEGNLTKDPEPILKNEMALPAGMWKGAGLSLVLNMLAATLSGGDSTHQVNTSGSEIGVSQVFLCFDPVKLGMESWFDQKCDDIIENLKNSKVFEGQKVLYPGENILNTRSKNRIQGVPVDKKVWGKILKELE
ncbi:3-dehydro-L-gulonate 2-dehydrogenase [Algoriphagus sp.]|uniref:3-dehydro-L-gulonate 2-dehydrogenase n=1 Tax=Algoriphagus sp. TaxID=1872435 RepID=UPI0025D78FF9|nr:3-dehydro-L-gulonate 2-dehydrogenase [Algoriphagus sp.]